MRLLVRNITLELWQIHVIRCYYVGYIFGVFQIEQHTNNNCKNREPYPLTNIAKFPGSSGALVRRWVIKDILTTEAVAQGTPTTENPAHLAAHGVERINIRISPYLRRSWCKDREFVGLSV